MNTFTTSLSPQNDDIIFNLQNNINFDPVINFGRVKGSFTDKFMRLAESSMATTYNYNHDSQLNANEQDLTDTSFWQGLIGQMIIPELTGSAKGEINNLLAELAKFDEKMSQNNTASNNRDGEQSIEYIIGEIKFNYNNLLVLKEATETNPFTFSAVGYNTVETVATYISDILSDGDLFIRVIKRLTDEIGIISTFKELMNGRKTVVESISHDSAIE